MADLTDAPTARTNLGLGDAATRNVGVSDGNLIEAKGSIELLTSSLVAGDASNTTYREVAVTRLGSDSVIGRIYMAVNTSGIPLIIFKKGTATQQIEFNPSGAMTLDGSPLLTGGDNLAALVNAATARTNLGLGSAATKDTGSAADQVVLSRTAARLLNRTAIVGSDGISYLEIQDALGNRIGYVGNASSTNSDIVLRSDLADVHISDTRGTGRAWHDAAAAKSLATTGYQALPSGLLIQWGRATTSAEVITFPLAFSTIYHISVTANRASTSSSAANVFNESLTGFEIRVDVTSGAGFWLAVGKA